MSMNDFFLEGSKLPPGLFDEKERVLKYTEKGWFYLDSIYGEDDEKTAWGALIDRATRKIKARGLVNWVYAGLLWDEKNADCTVDYIERHMSKAHRRAWFDLIYKAATEATPDPTKAGMSPPEEQTGDNSIRDSDSSDSVTASSGMNVGPGSSK